MANAMANAPRGKASKTSKSKASKASKSKRAEKIAKRNEQIVAAYAKGATVPQLSKKFGLSTIMVYRYLKALGVSLRPRAAAKPKVATKRKAAKTTKTAKAKASKTAKTKAAKPEASKKDA